MFDVIGDKTSQRKLVLWACAMIIRRFYNVGYAGHVATSGMYPQPLEENSLLNQILWYIFDRITLARNP